MRFGTTPSDGDDLTTIFKSIASEQSGGGLDLPSSIARTTASLSHSSAGIPVLVPLDSFTMAAFRVFMDHSGRNAVIFAGGRKSARA